MKSSNIVVSIINITNVMKCDFEIIGLQTFHFPATL